MLLQEFKFPANTESINQRISLDPQITVIFGSNGDLAKRKLFPAIFQLYIDHLLPKTYLVLGCGSQEKTDEEYRVNVMEMLQDFADVKTEENKKKAEEFIQFIYYQKVNNKELADFNILKKRLKSLSEKLYIPNNYIFYFSIPPFLYETVSSHLAAYGLNNQLDGWKRVIIEKPFGYSYGTALELDKQLRVAFDEEQIYRIDHYLGKETVQNILVTRFANGFFEPIWNRKYIDRVEITNAEKIGVGSRGGYYDTSGALRDMIQNHLLQILSVVAMEPPAIFDSESIRTEKAKVFNALRPIRDNEITDFSVRGQYKGYLEEEGVAPDSKTETFAAIKLFIDNWRWGDVPFYIRTGKYMPERVTEVVIHLKSAPHQLFKQRCISQSSNMIILRIQPDEGVMIDFGMKKPGAGYKVQNVMMNFRYADLADAKIPEAYERLLLDCMSGDTTLYSRADALLASWKFVDPILKAWKDREDIPLYQYDRGTWGPIEANALLGNKLLEWHIPTQL